MSRPITDSPWLWFFLFGAMALIALLAIGPKHARRQERIVRMQEARQRGSQATTPLSTTQPADTENVPAGQPEADTTLRFLQFFLEGVLTVGALAALGIGVWRRLS
jgi:hypothetical protein